MILGLALAAGVSWLGSDPWRNPDGQVGAECRLHRGACVARFPDGEMTLRVEGLSDHPVSALKVRVVLRGSDPRAVTMDLNGDTMNMGPNHTRLERLPDGTWQGETSLTACVSGAMTWAATVRAEVGWGTWTARFLFDTGA